MDGIGSSAGPATNGRGDKSEPAWTVALGKMEMAERDASRVGILSIE